MKLDPAAYSPLTVIRYRDHAVRFPEIKDPDILEVPLLPGQSEADRKYMMFPSIGHSDPLGDEPDQYWIVGRFEARDPKGPWQELAPVEFKDFDKARDPGGLYHLCAPAVTCEVRDGKLEWKMRVQTDCFSEDSYIAEGVSTNGRVFDIGLEQGDPTPAITHDMLEERPPGVEELVGVYDIGVSRIFYEGRPKTCLTFSGLRWIGCGDAYMMLQDEETGICAPARLILAQEEIPFHNRPGSPDFEWGTEAIKVEQLDRDLYLMIGVCFSNEPGKCLGTRQGVFGAVAASPYGPYSPVSMLLDPLHYAKGKGENGHPATIIRDGKLCIIFQARDGDHQPWYLHYAEVELERLRDIAKAHLKEPEPRLSPCQALARRDMPPSLPTRREKDPRTISR